MANSTDPTVYYPAKLVRLAFHDAGTFRAADKSGGPHAVMYSKCPTGTTCENNQAENAGLQLAMDFLGPIAAKYAGKISIADLWALAASVGLDYSRVPPPQRATAPVTPLATSPFKVRFGRTDKPYTASLPGSRLPDAESGWTSLKAIFVTGMGLTVSEAVALFGAHSLGRLNAANSGYAGPWDRSPTVFDNDYFPSLLDRKWTFFKIPDGRAGATGTLSIWKTQPPNSRVDPEAASMLHADMSLAIDNVTAFPVNTEFNPQVPSSFTKNTETFDIATGYKNDNAAFIAAFAGAFKKLTEFGYSDLTEPSLLEPSATPSAAPPVTTGDTKGTTSSSAASLRGTFALVLLAVASLAVAFLSA